MASWDPSVVFFLGNGNDGNCEHVVRSFYDKSDLAVPRKARQCSLYIYNILCVPIHFLSGAHIQVTEFVVASGGKSVNMLCTTHAMAWFSSCSCLLHFKTSNSTVSFSICYVLEYV